VATYLERDVRNLINVGNLRDYVVGQWLRWRDWHAPSLMLWHWCDQGGNEVDLLVEKDGKLLAVECKVKERPTDKDFRGIARLRAFYGREMVPRAYLACPVETEFDLRPDVTVVPGWRSWPLSAQRSGG
jgi:hypothetical protein